MHSLYEVLLAQHARQLTPVRCAYATVLQLHRYFGDVVLENNLSALVIESLPLSPTRSTREKARIRELARSGRRTFFFAHQADALNEIVSSIGDSALAAPSRLNASTGQFGIFTVPAESLVFAPENGRFPAILW